MQVFYKSYLFQISEFFTTLLYTINDSKSVKKSKTWFLIKIFQKSGLLVLQKLHRSDQVLPVVKVKVLLFSQSQV